MDCTEDDQLRVLRWAATRQDSHRRPADADLMAELSWSEEKAQSMLAALRSRGDLLVKDILLDGGGGYAMGDIRLTPSGLDRLADCEPGGRPGLFGRLVRLMPRSAGAQRR